MGTLQHCKRKLNHVLSSQTLVGRVPGCQLRYESGDGVSRHHAEISWNDPAWEVRDLASRNGTFVDGRKLASGETCALEMGARVAFGRPENVLELVEDGPPVASATPQDGQRRAAQAGTLYLPDENNPECIVHREDRKWHIDWPDRAPREIESGASEVVGGIIWTFDLPIDVARTVEVRNLSLDYATMGFRVSRDEEHVELELRMREKSISFDARNHWYTLLVMARQRLHDQNHGVIDSEAGWIDTKELQRQLKLPEPTFNTHVFRAKQQLAEKGIQGHHRLIERRRTRSVRIGISDIVITKV